jgi:hypothetical protein
MPLMVATALRSSIEFRLYRILGAEFLNRREFKIKLALELLI